MSFNVHHRARSRRYAMQALYQWQLSGAELADVKRQFLETEDFEKADADYFRKLLKDVGEHSAEIDDHIGRTIDRPINQLNPVEHAILRLAVSELLYHIEVPYRVVINEAVQLDKKFGAEQGHAFVNAVLDKLARELRAVEVGHAGGQAAGR